MKRFLILLALLSVFARTAGAKVKLPAVFGDNMVLQQKAEVAIWGTADGKTVTVSASWAPDAKVNVNVGKHGKWSAKLPTPEAGGPYELTVSDGEDLVLHNVLLGEVWFCSGQSNMSMPVRGFSSQPVEGSMETIISARPSVPIRMFAVKHRVSITPGEDCEGVWKENTPEAVAVTSATAYFFATRLQQMLEVPIGIINADWGGTMIESWMSREVLEKDFEGEFKLDFLDDKLPEYKPHRVPCTLFNGMVAPLVPYTIRGIIWYQGEANLSRPEQYSRLQPAYVRMMRKVFNNPDAPFYFVQIAPYSYDKPRSFDLGYFNEAQQKTLSRIPHSGMAPTVDLGECEVIHPRRKKEVGDRLAFLALADTYGFGGFNPHAPTYESVEFKGSEAVVTFKVSVMGLAPLGVAVTGFELAGEDQVFHPALARVTNKKCVSVNSPAVAAPVAVRYCFRNWSVGTVFSIYGIPVLPFRTDNWDNLK